MFRRALRPLVLLALIGLLSACSLPSAGCRAPQLRKVYTEHLGQLTGTLQNPVRDYAMTGTDLGVSYLEPGRTNRLIFLFGDSWTPDPARHDQDSAAWTQPFVLPDRNRLPKLFWFESGDQFAQVKVRFPTTINQGGMNVPVEGLAVDGRHYIFFTTGFNGSIGDFGEYCCSALAHTEGLAPEFDSLILDHVVESDKFNNISAFVQGETVWLFGSGPYRRSDVFLARVSPPSLVADRNAWQYYRAPGDFGPGEDTAQPVVVADCVGELSVRPHPQLGYLMLYNCGPELGAPRGIHLRRADNPWGPWDRPITIFDPGPDRGYGYFMHQKFSAAHVGYDDGLAEPGVHRNLGGDECPGFGWREECWGGEYGPYMVPQWFTANQDGSYNIVYTLSSWVPYQAHLMRTTLAWANNGGPQPPPPRGVDLPPASLTSPDFGGSGACSTEGWQRLGDPFVVFKGQDGRCRLTTYTPDKGDNALGALFQDFTVDVTTKALRFWVHGGEATVRMHRGAEIVRETRGRSGHEPRNMPETMACWNLGDYAGETLRVAVFDGKTGPWGFIGVTGFEFLKQPCGS